MRCLIMILRRWKRDGTLAPVGFRFKPYYGICILHELMRDILGIVCYRRRLWGFTVYFWVVDVSFDDRR